MKGPRFHPLGAMPLRNVPPVTLSLFSAKNTHPLYRQFCVSGAEKRRNAMNWSCVWLRVTLAMLIVFAYLSAPYLWAQTLGGAPQFNVAVKGQTGAQPEGAFFNFINWIGNVIAPVGAGGAVFGAVVSFISGRAVGRWLLTSAALLGVSGLTRLLEFWVLQGVGGVS